MTTVHPPADALPSTAAGSAPLGRGLSSPWTAMSVALLLYSVWIAIVLVSGHDPRDFAVIRESRIAAGHNRSSVIRPDPSYRNEWGAAGYDGQFEYFIALDPVNARYYVPSPSYRYTRIGYPILARLLALGNSSVIPYTLIIVNVLAVAATVLALARFLAPRGFSVWWSLVYALFPGIVWAVRCDLTEPLAFAFVAGGVLAMCSRCYHRLILGAGLFALAGLTREQTAIFPIVYGLALIQSPFPGALDWRQRKILSAAFVGGSLGPLLLWKLFLLHWLGSAGLASDSLPSLYPFAGVVTPGHWRLTQLEALCVVPSALCLLTIAISGARRESFNPELATLIANVVLFVLFLNSASYGDYQGLGRVTAGVVLMTLFSLPTLRRSAPTAMKWGYGAMAGWMPAWVLVYPHLYL